jgi:hypothetical protein
LSQGWQRQQALDTEGGGLGGQVERFVGGPEEVNKAFEVLNRDQGLDNFDSETLMFISGLIMQSNSLPSKSMHYS